MLFTICNIETQDEIIELDALKLHTIATQKYKCSMNMRCTNKLKPKHPNQYPHSRNKFTIDSTGNIHGNHAVSKILSTVSQHISTASTERTPPIDYYSAFKSKIVSYDVRSKIRKPAKCKGDDCRGMKI